MTSEALKTRSRKTLSSMARRKGVTGWHSMTKDELVRTLARLSRVKAPAPKAAPAKTRLRGVAPVASRRPRAVPATRRKPRLDVEPLIARSRDLCTQEVEDQYPHGRTNYVDATVCDTHWIKAEWDLTRDSIRRAESRLAAEWHRATPVIRLFAVSTEELTNVSDAFVKDVVIEAGVNTWYVNVPSEIRIFRLHIGYRTSGGTFFAVAKSNVCSMPLLSMNRTPTLNGDGDGHRGKGKNGQARNSKGGRSSTNGHNHSGMIPEGIDDETRLGRPIGFSSLAHFGPAATEEREKGEFSFKLETELIVHGSTRPGSCLAVQGDQVDLRDDGSFTIRVNQPEGRQVIAFTAMSPRGSERRMIVLGIERNTKELERQYFDGGHPEGFSE
jgi:uncharacterized protein